MSLWWTALVTAITVTMAAHADTAWDELLGKRNQLVQMVRDNPADALPDLNEALHSEHQILRLTAAHLLADLGEPAHETLIRMLSHEDAHVRIIMVDAVADLGLASEHVETLVCSDDPRIRRRFYLDILPRQLLVDGKPTDELIASFASAYEASPVEIQYEIIRAVAKLPLTAASTALVRRAADLEAASSAAEQERQALEAGERMVLIASQALLEKTLAKARELAEAEQWEALVELLPAHDLATWPDTKAAGRVVARGGYANERAEAYYLLARSYHELAQGEQAEQTLITLLGEVGLRVVDFRERIFYEMVLSLYEQTWQDHLQEKGEARQRYLRQRLIYGDRLAAAGREEDALEVYKGILQADALGPELRSAVQASVEQATKR